MGPPRARRPASRLAGQSAGQPAKVHVWEKNWPDCAPAAQDPHSFFYSDMSSFYFRHEQLGPEPVRIATVFFIQT